MLTKILFVLSTHLFLGGINCEEIADVRNTPFREEVNHWRAKRNINSDLIAVRLQEIFDEMNDIKRQNARLHANYVTTLENVVLKIDRLSGKIEDMGKKMQKMDKELQKTVTVNEFIIKHGEIVDKLDTLLQSGHTNFSFQVDKNMDSSAAGDNETSPMSSFILVPPSNESSFIEWQDCVVRNVNSYKNRSMTKLSNFLQRGSHKEKMQLKHCEWDNLIEGVFTSCFTLQNHFSGLKNGIYRIFPSKTSDAKTVYCDMETNGGGWTAFQRRGYSLTKSFNRNWYEYSNGFGNPEIEDYWLGLEAIHDLTKSCNNEIMMTGTHKNGTLLQLTFSTFSVANSSHHYKLTLNDYQPSLSNFNNQHLHVHYGQYFSTFDKDNEKFHENCAVKFKSGWWYNGCYVINPNSILDANFGIQWLWVPDRLESVNNTEFKIRPRC